MLVRNARQDACCGARGCRKPRRWRFCMPAGPASADAGFRALDRQLPRDRRAERHFQARPIDRAFRGVTDAGSGSAGEGALPAGIQGAGLGLFRQPRARAVDRRSAAPWRANASRWLDRIESAVRRRPQHPARHLVDGIELRRDPQEREGDAQRRALAGDPCLCRQEARQIRAHPADRGAEDPADAATSTRAT